MGSYLEYFSKKSTLKKILPYNFFLIFKGARACASIKIKKLIFLCARKCTILRIFSQKNRLSYLEYFSKKSTLEKSYLIIFFLVFKCANACARIKIKNKF